MLTINKITNNIINISASSQEELNMSFLRFQEHYESPVWRGKIFTLGQYRQWYAETNGAFTYMTDWAGFNIPSYVLKPFINGLFDPLTPNEQQIVEWFKDRKDNFYIIGTQEGMISTLTHEIGHGLFYTDLGYRVKIQDILRKAQKICPKDYQKCKTILLQLGYSEDVIEDEIHAFMLTGTQHFIEKNIDLEKMQRKQICDTFLQYAEKTISKDLLKIAKDTINECK